jgi:hypothetical protein
VFHVDAAIFLPLRELARTAIKETHLIKGRNRKW